MHCASTFLMHLAFEHDLWISDINDLDIQLALTTLCLSMTPSAAYFLALCVQRIEEESFIS